MRLGPLTLSLGIALALTTAGANAAQPGAGKPQIGSFGVDLSARDTAVKPGDDFNRYASGKWLDSYQLKDYETSFGSFNALRDRAEEQVHALIEELGKRGDLKAGSKVREKAGATVSK